MMSKKKDNIKRAKTSGILNSLSLTIKRKKINYYLKIDQVFDIFLPGMIFSKGYRRCLALCQLVSQSVCAFICYVYICLIRFYKWDCYYVIHHASCIMHQTSCIMRHISSIIHLAYIMTYGRFFPATIFFAAGCVFADFAITVIFYPVIRSL